MKNALADAQIIMAPSSSSSSTSEPPHSAIDRFINHFMETSDFVHILSLRARFLYASPQSCKKLLEYNSQTDLIGHHLHEFVHPADLVSVMRELRTSRVGDSINFLCRFKRKYSGYIYMEITGHVRISSNSLDQPSSKNSEKNSRI
jgi:hypothetical protein